MPLNEDSGLDEICQAWHEERRWPEVIDFLCRSHPCVTAVLLTQGRLDGKLTSRDANTITNLMVDRKVKVNEQRMRRPIEP